MYIAIRRAWKVCVSNNVPRSDLDDLHVASIAALSVRGLCVRRCRSVSVAVGTLVITAWWRGMPPGVHRDRRATPLFLLDRRVSNRRVGNVRLAGRLAAALLLLLTDTRRNARSRAIGVWVRAGRPIRVADHLDGFELPLRWVHAEHRRRLDPT